MKYKRGVSFVELIVVSAIILLVFGGLFASFQMMIKLIGGAKMESGALALATERLEYIRSLAYDSIGTVNGIPPGAIPQTRTVTINGYSYAERVLIEFIDSPRDGVGASDTNGILADYKQIKIEYSWNNRGVADTLFLSSMIVPRGIETTAGGGTLSINVFDADVLPVEDALVRIYNVSGTSTIDTTRYTNASGTVMVSGAPARSGYQITVTKNGFSTDGTYSASSTNQNPVPPHVAVIAARVSTMGFQIDELSNLTIETLGEPVIASTSDTFSNGSGIAASSSIQLSGGNVRLSGTSGSYAGSGSVTSVGITPGTLVRWYTLQFSGVTPTNTALRTQVYAVTGSSTLTLLPESALPGNSAGFQIGTVDLSGINASLYPSLALRANLSTTNASVTPELQDWELSYVTAEPVIGNTGFTLTGAKTIGTTGGTNPVYKYNKTHTTNGSGIREITGLEWDTYNVALSGTTYSVAEACTDLPYALRPGVSETLKIALAPSATRSLRVRVETAGDASILGASVTLSRSGFTSTKQTSPCGQTFFNSIATAANNYQVVVSAPGYATKTVTNVRIQGKESMVVVLSPQ